MRRGHKYDISSREEVQAGQETNLNPNLDSFSNLNSVSPDDPSVNETNDRVSSDSKAGEGIGSRQGEQRSLYPLAYIPWLGTCLMPK